MKTIKTWSAIACITALSWMAATCCSAVSNVYFDTFENYTAGTPLVDGTNYWYADSTNVIVQTIDGTKAAMLPIDTTLSNRFNQITNPTNIWIHMEVKPVRYDGTNYPVADTNAAMLFYVDSNGYFVGYDGSVGNWVSITQTIYGVTVSPVALNTWVTNLNVFLNFSSKTWQIALGADLLTNNLGFVNSNLSSMNGFSIYNGGSETTYLDNVYIYDQAPFAGYDVQPKALTNSSFVNSTAPDQTFNIIGGYGVRPLDYTIVTNTSATWLSVNPGSGTISNGLTNVITVSYPSNALSAGSYTSSLSVITTYGIGCTQTVTVTLRVVDWAITPTTLSSAVMDGYAPWYASCSTNFAIIIANTNLPGYTITTNAATSWMTMTSGTGTLVNGTNTIAMTFTTNGLAVGVHTAILTVATTLGGGLTDYVSVVATVLSRPIPAISSNSFSQTITKGLQPVSTNLIIHNLASAPRSGMRYNVTSTSAWLLATNSVCTNGEDRTITVQFADMRTNAGCYNGTLTIQTVDTNTTTVYTPVGQISSTLYVTVQVIISSPGTPGNLTASDGTDTGGIQLNWAATTNVNHYEVWRANSNVFALASMLASNVTVTNYYDTTVDPGLARWYWVRAINDTGGDGDFSAPNMGFRFLPAPSGLTATSGTYTNRVALSWTASFGAVNYEVWRSIYNDVGLASLLGTVSAAVTTYDDTTGDANQSYYYWVRSRTADMGNYSSSVTGYRAALAKPTGVSASKGTFNSKVRVTWQTVDGASQYQIWRSTDTSLGNATLITTVTILSSDDTSASASYIYYYWIRALDAQGYGSPYSDSDSGWLQLATPANVSATQGTRPYSVRVSWSAVANATSYEVARAAGAGLSALLQSLPESILPVDTAPSLVEGVVMLSETANTYYDDNASYAGLSYSYAVRAKNAQGNSEYSSAATGWRQVRQATTTGKVANDYDGDKLADVVLFNTGYGLWRILCTTLGEIPVYYGDTTCVPVQGDYDADGFSDPMIYSAAQSYLRLMISSANYADIRATFGGPGKLAAVADYDNDGRTDPAVFDPATGVMTIMFSGSGYVSDTYAFVGKLGYLPVSTDFDGDGNADPAVYSATDGLLLAKLSSIGYTELAIPLGGAGNICVPGDFDGDGKSELTTYIESTGTLSIRLSVAGYSPVNVPFGGPGYAWVVPADYDGDGLLDPAVYSQTNGWQIMFSGSGYATQTDSFSGANNVPFVP